MRRSVITAAHCSSGVSGWQLIKEVVITSRTGVVTGLRCSATTRRSTSRSVKIPTGFLPSRTRTLRVPRVFMSCAASSTVAPGGTATMSLPLRARMSRTVSTGTLLELPLLHLRKEVADVHVVLLLGRKRAVVLASLVRLGLGRLRGILLRQGGNFLVVALRHRCCSGQEVPLSTQRSGGGHSQCIRWVVQTPSGKCGRPPPPPGGARVKGALPPPFPPRVGKGRGRPGSGGLGVEFGTCPRGVS